MMRSRLVEIAAFAETRAELDSALNSIQKNLNYPHPPEELPWYSPGLWTLSPNRCISLLIFVKVFETTAVLL